MKKKIIFILPSLYGGGAERIVLNLLKHIDRSKFTPVLALVKKEGRYLQDVPKDVELIDLEVKQARYSLFKIAKLIREQKPDIIFTSLSHLNLLIALIRPFFSKKIKFIARESNTVSEQNKRDKYPKINDLLYKLVYNNYDLIVTQAKAMRDDLMQNYNIDKAKMKIIYNPVDIDYIKKRSDEKMADLPKGKFNLLAVGRLSEQKGYDLLLESFAKLDESFYLTILGEGEKKDELENKIKELDIENRVDLRGFSSNPYAYMKEADLLVLSSRYEGLPNVVLEANSLGVGVVAYDSSGGTGEIVKDGVNGYLVKPFDTDEFAFKILYVKDHQLDTKVIANIIQNSYRIDKIIKEYEAIFSEC